MSGAGRRPRILVTNDDGIDSVGLHVLARAMVPLGEVVVAAPDSEYSGASSAIGAIHLIHPEIHRTHLDGLDEVWAVTGPPALCVMFSRLGAFGEPFDLVVSGINPGANVGRSVYHSGTVGAALTARTGGVSGVAVSQDVPAGSFEGQAWDEMIADLRWDTAADVAAHVVAGLLDDLPAEPVVLNLNVPNLTVDELKGWRHTSVAANPGRTSGGVKLVPKIGHEGTFRVELEWGQALELPEDCDVGAVRAGYVAVSWLSGLTALEPDPGTRLDRLIDALGADQA